MANKKIWLGILAMALVLVFGLGLTSCETTLNWQKLELGDLNVRGQLPNLQNATTGVDSEWMNRVERIMSNFVDTSGEQMGYYTVNFTRSYRLSDGGYVLSFLTGFFVYTPALFGMPFQVTTETVSAYLSIYDSQGNLVESFRRTGDFTLATGLYYGHDATKKAGEKYTELFKDLLEQVNMKSKSITDLLNAAGPVTIGNTTAARSKIVQSKL
ncbi:MAG: hypothetical protein LBQ82_03185 [Treponema sp.]|jgi:hypothetical protein|nr:hypothetical protein [Treponema sp.]